MKDLKQFIGIYPVSKTLRFELRPVGKTQEWIEKNKMLESDEQKAEDYPKVKALIDDYHKVCIRESLKDIHIDWQPLKTAIEANRKDNSEETKKSLEKEQENMRKQIAAAIKDFRHYKELTAPTPQKLIDKVFPEIYDDEALKSFNRFSIYFRGFQENRKNIYSVDAISTGVPYRLVHDNFPKFLVNIEVYENIKTLCPEVLEQVAKELQPFLEGVMIDDIFKMDFYNALLTQEGIDFFNQVLGGVAEKGKQKYRGINEFSNLYRQQHPELGGKKKALTMIPLFKQILFDRETLSYIPQQIESEQQMTEAINHFYTYITNYEKSGKTVNILSELSALIENIYSYNSNGIFISSKNITDISQKVMGHWSIINDKLQSLAIEKYGSIDVAKNKKKIDSYLNKDAFSLSELSFDDEHKISIYFAALPNDINNIHGAWLQYQEWCKGEGKQLFLNNPDGTEIVKNLLDSMMEFLHKCSVLLVSEEYDVDKDFYNEFIPFYTELSNVIFLYNKVRNFLTKKPSDVKKFKLNFGVPSLGDGWDQNKERDNKAIILFKDGLSYLGILNAKDMPEIKEKDESTPSSYKKMIYKLLADPAKVFPHTFFSKKGIDTYHPSDYILNGREQGKYKKGSTFDKKFMHDLIDFYKDAVAKHPLWKKFNFVFSPTESYEDIGAFFSEV